MKTALHTGNFFFFFLGQKEGRFFSLNFYLAENTVAEKQLPTIYRSVCRTEILLFIFFFFYNISFDSHVLSEDIWISEDSSGQSLRIFVVFKKCSNHTLVSLCSINYVTVQLARVSQFIATNSHKSFKRESRQGENRRSCYFIGSRGKSTDVAGNKLPQHRCFILFTATVKSHKNDFRKSGDDKVHTGRRLTVVNATKVLGFGLK